MLLLRLRCMQALKVFEARSTYPITRTEYRVNPTDAVKADFVTDAATEYMHFGVGHQPFSAADYATLTTAGTGVIHVPIALTTYSVFFNLPGQND